MAEGPDYHPERSDRILAAVTSQVRPASTLGEFVLASWKMKPSVMKSVIATVERGLVLRTLGTLTDDDRVRMSPLRALGQRSCLGQTGGLLACALPVVE